MSEVEYLEVQILIWHNVEEALEDKDSDIFDTILLNDSVEVANRKLNVDVFVTSKCIHLYIFCLAPNVYSGKCL